MLAKNKLTKPFVFYDFTLYIAKTLVSMTFLIQFFSRKCFFSYSLLTSIRQVWS